MKAKWVRSRVLLLDGTFLELWPEYGFMGGYWLVVDSRRPNKLLGSGAMLLKDAKQAAIRYNKDGKYDLPRK